MDKYDIETVALAQKRVLWCELYNLFYAATAWIPLSPNIPRIILLISLIEIVLVIIASLYAVYKLAVILDSRVAILYSIGMIFPIVSLVILSLLSQKATKFLQAEGLRVGFMGVSKKNLEKYKHAD